MKWKCVYTYAHMCVCTTRILGCECKCIIIQYRASSKIFNPLNSTQLHSVPLFQYLKEILERIYMQACKLNIEVSWNLSWDIFSMRWLCHLNVIINDMACWELIIFTPFKATNQRFAPSYCLFFQTWQEHLEGLTQPFVLILIFPFHILFNFKWTIILSLFTFILAISHHQTLCTQWGLQDYSNSDCWFNSV